MTFSLLARDPDSGQLGVAVTSCTLAVGRAVPWARAGVGAVATQALPNRSYGPRGLDLMSRGTAAADALGPLVAGDPEAAQRQVGLIATAGPPAGWTGGDCLPACGHIGSADLLAVGNMLASRSVVPSMADGYAAADGDLAARLLAGLRAGQDAGGDLRGRQSAALLVVSGDRNDAAPWEGVLVDLRVDDAADPIAALDRLLRMQRAYESGDWETLARQAPDGVRDLHAALAAAQRGDREAARGALQALRARPGWEGWLRRLRVNGRLPYTEELLR